MIPNNQRKEKVKWHHEDDSNSISADEALGRKRMKDVRVRDRDKDRERERKTDDETEFRLVQTKKHRRRKRRSSHNEQISQADVFRTARSSPDRNHHHHHSHHRTSSMPPSDRSDCSDLDSVHSLPVTTSRRGTTPSSGQEANSPSGHSRSSSGSYAEASAGFTPSGGEMNNNSVGKGKHVEASAGLTPSGAEMNNNSVGNNSVGKGKHPAGPKQKSASCHSSSISVHEPGLGPTPLTQSTPNSTINLAANNINLAANAANVSGRRHTATRSCSPETKPNGPTPRDAQTKDWHKSGPRRASITNVNSNSTSEPPLGSLAPLVNGSLEPPGHRQPLCNGEPYESVTLCLNNNNKHRAPSPPPNCDVFVEFNLPPPPCPSAPQVNPVDVTVEKTVIIRSQHCVSESVSLVIPPPSSSLTNPTPNHAHPPTNPTPVNHWTVTNSTPSHASHGTVANTTVNHAQHPVPTNPTAVNHASQASLTDPTRVSHAHHPAPANPTPVSQAHHPANPTSHAPTNPTKRSTRSGNTATNISHPMPPVVLLDRKARAAQPCDLTFGFEINKQLLNRGGDLAAKEAVRLGSAVFLRSTRSGNTATNISHPMPPVVLLDRKARAAQPCDLTFGFEINKQLLNRGGDLAAKEAVRLGSAAADCRTDCFNYTDIVNFIGNDKDRERERKTDDETEFRLVQTKKHRRRKRRSSHNEQTVIIRSQHCVSESVSLVIPPPSSSLTNPTPNHAHPPANPTPVNHWTVTNSTPSHASHGTVANTTVNHAQHPVPTNPTAVNHASQASLTDPTRVSHAHHPAPANPTPVSQAHHPANPTSHAPTNPTKRWHHEDDSNSISADEALGPASEILG
ncbi:rho GTPase-activating protein gacF [Diaphorina citri]|uniref:Rho GTPase-activating protein gacF n=1 Tax=Diaphorina citri TaxID=121845 RepID=A0A3Q0IW68_DIACI|nr:rho GTPase-activating protein gacF [Diaphorina citri]